MSEIRTSEIEVHNNDKRCAPSKSFDNVSCIDVNVLIDMAHAYNSEFPNDKIKMYDYMDSLNPRKYKKYLAKQFSHKLKDVCANQRCWIKQKFTKRMNDYNEFALKKNTFRPKGPNGRFEWLNTFNIDNVLSQYESKHNSFKSFGAVPIDFADLNQLEIAKFNIHDLYKKNKTKIGVVFNLDEHYKSGSHWVALYADLEQGQIYFSDSYGTRPEKRIRKFMRELAADLRNKHKKMDIRYNKTRHQYGNSECGVYSINFIVRLLGGESFEKLTKTQLSDDDVNKCREVYFNNVNIK